MSVETSVLKALFLAALEKATPAERAAYLDEACAGDARLRQRVEVLLAAHDRPDPLLDQPAGQYLAAEESKALDFLEPSARPGALGRLGHYEVLDVVGRGGMGVVLRAFDEKLQRVVAIKVLAPLLAGSATARRRFVREARAAAAVTHDNVIDIHAVEDAGPVPYLVMQYIHGKTVQQLLDGAAPLELHEILRIGLQIAEGLAAAHRQGLIHRDIKPANILLENGVERVKITDFGLARAAADASLTQRGDSHLETTEPDLARAAADASLTQTGLVAGTPLYMSPEQARGEPVDQRSDLFSLGSVLYALCTGQPPFPAGTALTVLEHVCENSARPIREVNPVIPGWLEAIVARLHAKNPAERFPTAAEVATLLSRHLAQLQTGAADTAPRGEPDRLGAGQKSSHPWLWLSLGLVLAGLAGAAWFLQQNRPGEAKEANGAASAAPAVQPWRPRPPRSAEELAKLSSPLDGRKRADIPRALLALAGGGDPDRAPPELVAVLGEQAPVQGLAVSPEGRFVACGGNDHLVRLWDLAGWQAGAPTPPCRLLKGHTNVVWSVVFSPDGRTLASGSYDGTIILWDVATARKTGELLGHSRRHSLLAFSPDGQTLAAGGEDGTINRWDVSTRQRRKPWALHTSEVRAVAYSPDGRLLASAGNDGLVQVIDATGRRRHLFRGDSKRTNVAFRPDGKVLAATCDWPEASVRFWDVQSGEELEALSGHATHVGGLAFHPLGRLVATGSWDLTARVWDRRTGESRVLPIGPAQGVRLVSVAWSPEGRYLAAARENLVVCLFRISPAAPR
jgi:serine/threonine protein kinase